MSIRQGKKLIASSTTNGFNLFDCKWADHILNNISWLRADTFSWQSGDVYTAAYEHLREEWDVWWTTHTVADLQFDGNLAYAVMPDGHRICGGIESAVQEQEGYLIDIYNNKGVAWYYLLDTTNRQFKLPRTKWGFTGLRDTVGGYVPQNVLLPDIYGSIGNYWTGSASGAFYNDTSNLGSESNTDHNKANTSFKASRISSVYSGNGKNTLIQPRGTQMYLYFFVGNFEQSAIEQTAGLNAEMFNDLNAHKVIKFQIPTTSNGYTWYRKYADGWVEQGVINVEIGTAIYTFNFPILMANTNYAVMTSVLDILNTTAMTAKYFSKATTGVNVRSTYQASSIRGDIMVCGMSA